MERKKIKENNFLLYYKKYERKSNIIKNLRIFKLFNLYMKELNS